MDYKKIIRSRSMRKKILNLLSFVPDSVMLRLQYFIKFGRKLNLKNPQRYSEKLQWYKLHYRDPLMAQCVDKYDVREYIKNIGMEHILNDCFGVYDSPEEIDFDRLPEKFVLKDTLGGGGSSVIICSDREAFDTDNAVKQMKAWVAESSSAKGGGREWPYYVLKRKHRIVAERYIESCAADGGLIDYKFFCFEGKAQIIYGIADRTLGAGAGLGIYDREFRQLDVIREDERPLERTLEKPTNFSLLRDCAEKISQAFPHARIDLYDQDGQIRFGEITFFDGSGYMKFNPDEFDYTMGDIFELPQPKK